MSEFEIKRKIRSNNHFEILEVHKNCTEAELKQAYKRMALIYHPDKNKI